MPATKCITFLLQYPLVIIFYAQDSDVPLPKVFIEIGWPVAQWIVTIGGIFGLCARNVDEWNKYNKFVYAIIKLFNISTIAIYYRVDFLFEPECIQIMRLRLKPRDSKVTNMGNESFTLFQVDS